MNVSLLRADLKREKVIGKVSDPFTFSLMWSSSDTLLLRYISNAVPYSCWVLVRRTSKQYYKVLACVTRYDFSYTAEKCFRNSQLTTEYIKEFIK